MISIIINRIHISSKIYLKNFRFDELTPELLQISDMSDDDSKLQLIENFLNKIGFRGLQTLLRQRKTAGSINYILPSRKYLTESFNMIYKDELTVGARALDKHCHRSKTDKFWGTIKGKLSVTHFTIIIYRKSEGEE